MPTNLDRLADVVAKMTPGEWSVVFPGHGERCQCAVIEVPGAYGPHQVVVDHRRDYTDPAPDAAGIVALRNCAEELIAVARAARDFRALKASEAYNRQGESKGRRDALDDALAALDAKLAEQSPT